MRTFRLASILVVSPAVIALASQTQSASADTIAAAVDTDCVVGVNSTCENPALELLQKGAKQNRGGGSHAGKLSTWRRRQLEYAPISDEEWDDLIGEGGVYYKDMHQGGLGDCYLLAGLTTVAAVHPQIIRNMFVRGATGDNPVVTTKWMVNGKQTYVAMNTMLPTDGKMTPFFARPKGTSYWPSLLEKAWAKIFGDYKTVEGGMQREAFKCITQAPVSVYKHSDIKKGRGGYNAKHFWNTMAGAQKYGYVVGAGTGNSPCNDVGLYCGHAYAVIGTFAIQGFPQVVKLYNPHGANKYTGELKHLSESFEVGEFWMTFNEYLDAFSSTDVASTIENAGVSDILLDAKNEKNVVVEFDMEQDGPFFVQFEWPMRRFFSKDCDIAEPTFTMAVLKKDEPTDSTLLEKQSMQMSTASAVRDGGKGTYQIAINVDFPYSGSWLKDFVVNVYGPKTELRIAEDAASAPLFLASQGLCPEILVPGTAAYSGFKYGEFVLDENIKIHGMPVFKRVAEATKETLAHPAYGIIYWDPIRQINGKGTMKRTGVGKFRMSPTIAHAKQGAVYRALDGIEGTICKPKNFQERTGAAQADTEEALVVYEVSTDKWEVYDDDGEFLEEEDPDENAAEFADGNSTEVQSPDCGKYALRITELDNGVEIAETGEDSMFPDSMKAIARSGQSCGDTATGITESCEKFNKWKSLEDIREAVKTKKALTAKCADDCNVDKDCVTVYEKSGKAQSDFTMCTGEGNWPMKYKCSGGKFFRLKAAGIYNLPSWVLDDDECKADTPISQCKESTCQNDGCITKVEEGGRCKVDFKMCGGAVKYKCSGGRAFSIKEPKRYSLPAWVCSDAECAPEEP